MVLSGRRVGGWLRRAFNQVHYGECPGAVLLLPARTDTRWFHDWATLAQEIVFICGRVTFVGAPAPAPFPSVFVVYRKTTELRRAPLYDTWAPRSPRRVNQGSFIISA